MSRGSPAPYRRSVHLRRPSPVALALASSLALAACSAEPFDTTRKTEPRGTLGEEIFGLFHRDFVREDERKADGFDLERAGFVGAIDHLFPPDELRYTQDFLVKLLPLEDDGTIPGATRKLSAVVARMSQDGDVMRSAAVLLQRAGYVDLDHEAALVRRIAAYPEFRPLAKALLRPSATLSGTRAWTSTTTTATRCSPRRRAAC